MPILLDEGHAWRVVCEGGTLVKGQDLNVGPSGYNLPPSFYPYHHLFLHLSLTVLFSLNLLSCRSAPCPHFLSCIFPQFPVVTNTLLMSWV